MPWHGPHTVRLWRQLGTLLVGAMLAACSNDDKTATPSPLAPTDRPRFATNSTGSNLDQWANGVPPAKAASWQNGNLNGNNATYGEGKVVPFRLALEGLPAGQHFITIQHDFTAGGHKAYDFLTNADATETGIFDQICAVGGGAVSSLCGSSAGAMPGLVPYVDVPYLTDTFEGPAGRTVAGAITGSSTAGTRKLRIYGVTNANQVLLSAMSHDGDFLGNSTAQFVVTFTPDVAGPVLIVWGGHLAESGYWDANAPPNGASTISGAPWHMRAINLDNGGAANQDRSIQPSALVPPVLSIVKTANPVGPVNAGDAIGFDVTLTNKGPGSSFNVVINDPLPGATGINWSTTTTGCSITGSVPSQTLHCTLTSLSDQVGSNTFTAHVTSATSANPESPTCGQITNAGATASATNSAQVTSGPASVTVACPANVNIQKVAVTGTVDAGTSIAFDITVTNTGLSAATNVGVADPLPSASGLSWTVASQTASACTIVGGSLTCTIPSLAANGGTYTVRITSPTTLASCGTVSNTASLQAPYSGFQTAQVTVNCPNVSVQKTAVSASVNAGDPVQFDITMTNTGLGKAFSVGISDPLPSFGGTWSVVSQTGPGTPCAITATTLTCAGITLAGSGGSYTVRVQSTTDGSVCTTVQNTASLTSPYSGSSQAQATVNCPNVHIAKTAVSATVDAGSPVQFDIAMTNTGLAPAPNAGFTDALPSFGGTWSIVSQTGPGTPCGITGTTLSCAGITLAASTGTYTVRVQSTTNGSVCTGVQNTANLSSPYSGTSSATVTVNCPQLTLAKAADASPVLAGSQIGFTVTVGNTGKGAATNVQVTDPLPAGDGVSWTIVGSPTGWAINGSAPTQTLVYTNASLAASASSVVHVVSATTGASCKQYDNTAQATLANGTAPADAKAGVLVQCPAKLTVKKTVVGGGSQLFDFTQSGSQNPTYQLAHLGSKVSTYASGLPATVTVCEQTLAVSWHASATLDGQTVQLTNPDAPLQDYGTRCADVSLDYGSDRTLAWTNTPPPQGDTRTIGYWKNWASCATSGGNQWTKALARGLWDKTLDGNLPQTVGLLTMAGAPDVSPADGKPDVGQAAVGCADAENLLDKSDVKTAKKMASDPAYNMAAQMLAALLNYNAQAHTCASVTAALSAAQSQLVAIKFNGSGPYAKALSPALTSQFNAWATLFDNYNNNLPCQ